MGFIESLEEVVQTTRPVNLFDDTIKLLTTMLGTFVLMLPLRWVYMGVGLRQSYNHAVGRLQFDYPAHHRYRHRSDRAIPDRVGFCFGRNRRRREVSHHAQEHVRCPVRVCGHRGWLGSRVQRVDRCLSDVSLFQLHGAAATTHHAPRRRQSKVTLESEETTGTGRERYLATVRKPVTIKSARAGENCSLSRYVCRRLRMALPSWALLISRILSLFSRNFS